MTKEGQHKGNSCPSKGNIGAAALVAWGDSREMLPIVALHVAHFVALLASGIPWKYLSVALVALVSESSGEKKKENGFRSVGGSKPYVFFLSGSGGLGKGNKGNKTEFAPHAGLVVARNGRA